MNDTNPIAVGETVLTSYGSGPYRINKVQGPCTCPEYLESINVKNPKPSEPHYHLTCSRRESSKSNGDFYLNGYRNDGTNVWSQDYLIFPFRSQPYLKKINTISVNKDILIK